MFLSAINSCCAASGCPLTKCISLAAPEVVLVVCGLLILLWEAIGKPASRTIGIAVIGSYLLAALIMWPFVGQTGVHLWEDLYIWDRLAVFGKFFFLITGILVTWLSLEYEYRLPVARAEFLTLPLFVTAGMLVLCSVNDFILLFVALELVTVSFYVLVGFQRNNTVALEAAVKYLIMGALSSAFLVMGIAYVFGFTGSTQFQVIRGYIEANGISLPLIFGMAMIIVGLGFKVAAVPFHIWAPDVYQGAPTPITAFLSVGSKAAGFFLLIRIFDSPFGSVLLEHHWVSVLFTLSALSLVLGNLAALPQRNLKRLLAYSGISHAGFMIAALASNNSLGHTALLFYLAVYLIASFIAFMVITVVARDSAGESMVQFSGLGQRSPLLAWTFALSLISMAGIPPLAGFFAKLLVFLAVWQTGHYFLVGVMVVTATIGLYYYIGVIRYMFWSEPNTTEPLVIHCSTKFLLLILTGLLLVLGLFSQPLLNFAANSF